ncbi:DNA repair protein XRCC2-like [Oopsacas minuta]|uniref:DNA repair protein XRCC2-like n=1 Tax=Oopsacas minuta TaxID=111878 RepID=A0AAV7JGM8_9METZ|nr:DNA repair protein XRCC2-like [Oopsacas minuta]
MDKYLSETGDHLFSRLSHKEIDLTKHPLFSKEILQMKTVRSIEITGTDFSDKNTLLHEIIISTLLPDKFEDYIINGQNVGVILFDCELNFPILAFAKFLESRITYLLRSNSAYISDFVEVSPIHVSRLKELCLSRLWLYKISSVLELHANLLATIDFITGMQDTGLILIDGISQYLWMDVNLSEQGYTDTQLVNRFISILQKIEFSTNLTIMIAGTVDNYGNTKKQGSHIEGQTFKRLNSKSKAWEQYFRCRIMLEKQGSTQMAYIRVSNNNQSSKVELQFEISEKGFEIIS